MGTLHEDQYAFLIISRPVLLGMKCVSFKSYRENQNTQFVFNNFYSFENHAGYEITWKNIIEPERPQMTIWHMLIACGIPKTANTHSKHVILIGLPLKQWLHEHTWMLFCMYIACLVEIDIIQIKKIYIYVCICVCVCVCVCVCILVWKLKLSLKHIPMYWIFSFSVKYWSLNTVIWSNSRSVWGEIQGYSYESLVSRLS